MNMIFTALAAMNAFGYTNASDNLSTQTLLEKFNSIKSQKGVTMIEYALIAALVSIAVLGTLQALGPQLDATFQAILTAITPAGAGD